MEWQYPKQWSKNLHLDQHSSMIDYLGQHHCESCKDHRHVARVSQKKVLKEKVQKLSKDLANYVAGTKNLDKFIRIQKGFGDKTGLGFN